MDNNTPVFEQPSDIIALSGIAFWEAFWRSIDKESGEPVIILAQEAMTRAATWDRDPSCDLLQSLRDPDDLDSSESPEKCGPLDRRLDEICRDFYHQVLNNNWTAAYDWYLMIRQRVLDLNARTLPQTEVPHQQN